MSQARPPEKKQIPSGLRAKVKRLNNAAEDFFNPEMDKIKLARNKEFQEAIRQHHEDSPLNRALSSLDSVDKSILEKPDVGDVKIIEKSIQKAEQEIKSIMKDSLVSQLTKTTAEVKTDKDLRELSTSLVYLTKDITKGEKTKEIQRDIKEVREAYRKMDRMGPTPPTQIAPEGAGSRPQAAPSHLSADKEPSPLSSTASSMLTLSAASEPRPPRSLTQRVQITMDEQERERREQQERKKEKVRQRYTRKEPDDSPTASALSVPAISASEPSPTAGKQPKPAPLTLMGGDTPTAARATRRDSLAIPSSQSPNPKTASPSAVKVGGVSPLSDAGKSTLSPSSSPLASGPPASGSVVRAQRTPQASPTATASTQPRKSPLAGAGAASLPTESPKIKR